jgi:hypothetical protein
MLSRTTQVGSPHRVTICLLLLAVQAICAGAAHRFLASAGRLDCFDFLEVTLTLDTPAPGNPFTDAVFTGEFACEGAPARRVDGFCDSANGRVFRVRFMPQASGRHHYKLRFLQGNVAHEYTGSFLAKRGERPGLVRVDPEHPFHFIQEGGGKHWFWNSTTTYQLLAWDDATIEQSLRRLARLGVTRIRVAICGRTPDGMRWNEPLVHRTDKFQFKMEPWIAARPANVEDPGYDVTRFNVEFFRKAERMLRLARDLDIVVSIIFYLDGADKGVDPFGKERRGSPEEQRYYRYVVARFGAFANVMWDVTNEWHLFRDEAWVNRMGAFIHENDPYHHLASVHGHGQFPFRTNGWADFAMFQSWDEHGGYQFMLNNRREQAATGRPMPQINEEYGYEDHYPYPWGEARLWPARTADNRRRLAWEMTMAGGYQTTGERANAGTGAGLDTGGGWINGRGNDQMTLLVGYGHLRRFCEGFHWWKLEPHPELLRQPPEPKRAASEKKAAEPPPLPVLRATPMCLAEPGTRYVLYLPQGGTVTVNLAPGSYRARWFNPRSGQFSKPAIPASGGVWTSPPAADAEDWVLLLERRQ